MPLEQTLSDITALFEQRGADAYYGEPVTQLEHALQCASLAERSGADDETVIAAFLHDIGHLLPATEAGAFMDHYGRVDHERLGADYLRQRGFSEKVAQLIEQHVNAKRYLMAQHPNYEAGLSEASRQTLRYQGGPMTADEAARFEQHPYFADILRVRRWDEQAKEANLPLPDPIRYYETCWNHLDRRTT